MANTIVEDNGRFTVQNARPLALRVAFGFIAPIAIVLLGVSMVGDVQEHSWLMLAFRLFFALTLALATRFALFGAESIGVEGGELVWRRGSSQERRCPVGRVERLEQQGTQLLVHIRDDKYPIIVGAGLRQPEAAMAWLSERLNAAITAKRTGT